MHLCGRCIIKMPGALGIRVTADEELEGLDVSEHGMRAYAQTTPDDSLILEDVGHDYTNETPAVSLKLKVD